MQTCGGSRIEQVGEWPEENLLPNAFPSSCSLSPSSQAQTLRPISTYFRNMPRKVFSLDESSGAFSGAATVGGAELVDSTDMTEAVIDGAGEGRVKLEPDDDEAIMELRYLWGSEAVESGHCSIDR